MSTRGNWVKVDAALFTDPKIAAAGWPGNVIFITLLLLNGQNRRNGRLTESDVSPLGLARLMSMTEVHGRSDAVEMVKNGIDELKTCGLLLEEPDGFVLIAGWEKWRVDSSSAERQSRYRRRKKAAESGDAGGVTGNAGDVTGDAGGVTGDAGDVTGDAGGVTGDARSEEEQKKEQKKRVPTHIELEAGRVISEWAKARASAGITKRPGVLVDGLGTGFSKNSFKTVMSKIKTRLKDDGTSKDSVTGMADVLIVAMQTPLNDTWMIENGKGLPFIIHNATRLEEAYSTAVREGVTPAPSRISENYDVPKAQMLEFGE